MIRRGPLPPSLSPRETRKASAFLHSSNFDKDTAYIERGRLQGKLTDAELISQWREALTAQTDDVYSLPIRLLVEDLDSELRLRSILPPLDQMQDTLTKYLAAVDEARERLKREDPQAFRQHAARVQAEWDAYQASKRKPKQ